MGCCESSENEKELAEVKQNEARSCTDIFCLLLFVVFWGLIIFVIGHAGGSGANPDRILRGANLNGQICGIDNPDPSKNLAAWPNPAYYKQQICVQSCDETLTSKQYFWENYQSKEFLHRCIPLWNQTVAVSISFQGDFNGELGTRSFADVWVVKYEIMSSALVAIALSALYLVFVRKCAGTLVWICIVLTIIGGFFTGYTLLQSAQDAKDSVNPDNRHKALEIAGWVFVVGTAIFTLLMFFMRKKIKLAIKMAEISTKVLQDIPSVVVFPVFVGVVFSGYILLWIVITVYVFSVGDLVSGNTPLAVRTHIDGSSNGNPENMMTFTFAKDYRNYVIPHIFGLFWNTQFLLYFGYMVIASAAADWYFTIIDGDGKKVRGNGPSELSNFPVLESTYRTLRFHLGSIAFGSLIIAIIKTIRAIITYLQEKANSEDPNVLQKLVFCLLQCVLKCVECCIDKINKIGYVYIAVYGVNFCSAATSSFALLMRNLSKVAILNMVSSYLTLSGKYAVAILTTGIFGILFRSYIKTDIGSPIVPLLVVFIFSYGISSLFMEVYETVVDTLFVCFMIDLDHNSGGSMMAPDELQRLVNEHRDESADAARKKKLLNAKYRGDNQEQSQPLAY